KLNQNIFQSERALIHDGGLPRRPWFRHQIYAPGFYTGYGVKTLPGVREAIENHDWAGIGEQIQNATAAINRLAAQIRVATDALAN
ncbi:MAG: transferrin receptor-like dimerization domain-containing protein, partial [Verrucomicrobiota bacterium]|nr:transferrin receptor-like dimerization domain-containing protein [Verrucomicrobiota bacterium]